VLASTETSELAVLLWASDPAARGLHTGQLTSPNLNQMTPHCGWF